MFPEVPPALQPEGVACGLAAGLTPCVPSAPGASASPTAPGLGWRPSPAWGTPTAAGECVWACGAGSRHRRLVGVVTVARDHRPGSWANSVRVEGARSGCLPARPHPHCRGSGRSRTLARLGQRSGGVLVRAVSSCRAFLSVCAPSHLRGAAPQPLAGPSRPTVSGSGVCLQDRPYGNLPGLHLPAVAADGGRRLGRGLRVLRAAVLRAERRVPDPQHVLGPDGADGRQVGAGTTTAATWPGRRRPTPGCRAGRARPRGCSRAPRAGS